MSVVSFQKDPGSVRSSMPWSAWRVDPELRAKCGRAARDRVLASYTVEDMGTQHRELYGRLLATAALRGSDR